MKSATSMMMWRPQAFLKLLSISPERRFWFMFEASRKADSTGH
jgi:hypothetical protein